MFNLTLVDHIRLSFGHVAQNYTRHAQAADRLAGLALNARLTILVLMGISVGLSAAVGLGAGRTVQIALVVTLLIAFLTYALVASIALIARRDALIQQFGELDEQGMAVQSATTRGRPRAHSPARALTEEQIDEYLPLALRKTGQSEAEPQTSH